MIHFRQHMVEGIILRNQTCGGLVALSHIGLARPFRQRLSTEPRPLTDILERIRG